MSNQSQMNNEHKPMSFKERAKIAIEKLAEQKPISLEQKREQAKRVLARTEGKNRKSK